MVKMKGMGELENLSYKEMRGTYFYETFHFEGSFCHESKHKSSTPKFFEILGGMNRGESAPERIMVHCRSEETGETFEAFVEMKIVSLEQHHYKASNDEDDERNTKDAKKNQKFLGHLPNYPKKRKPKKPPAKPRRLQVPINEWG